MVQCKLSFSEVVTNQSIVINEAFLHASTSLTQQRHYTSHRISKSNALFYINKINNLSHEKRIVTSVKIIAVDSLYLHHS